MRTILHRIVALFALLLPLSFTVAQQSKPDDKSLIKLTKRMLLFVLMMNMNNGYAQSFYEDYVKYLDARANPKEQLSRSKRHLINKQFASEYKKLFNEVGRKMNFDMLNCDTLYIFSSQPDFYSSGYSKLVWNSYHSCYYENLHFSRYYKCEKVPITIEADAKQRLSALGVVLKEIIQHTDSAQFRKYIYSSEAPALGAIVKFIVATREKEHWHFFTSRAFAFQKPE